VKYLEQGVQILDVEGRGERGRGARAV